MTENRRPDIDELISLVEVPGPLPDGVEDALWESTAGFYEQRIGAREWQPEREVIVSPGPGDPAHGRRRWLFAAAAALVGILAVALAVVPRSDEGDDPVTTQVPTTTTTTTVPGSEYLGVVWENAENPARVNVSEGRPELADGPLTARIDSFVITPGPDESPFCASAVDQGATGPGGEERVLPEIDSCLIVEWQFDVSAEAANNAFMGAEEAATPAGERVEPLVYDFPIGPPGRSASGSVVFPNLGPGSRIDLGYEATAADGGLVFERWEVVVPDAFQPIDWFEDEG